MAENQNSKSVKEKMWLAPDGRYYKDFGQGTEKNVRKALTEAGYTKAQSQEAFDIAKVIIPAVEKQLSNVIYAL